MKWETLGFSCPAGPPPRVLRPACMLLSGRQLVCNIEYGLHMEYVVWIECEICDMEYVIWDIYYELPLPRVLHIPYSIPHHIFYLVYYIFQTHSISHITPLS